MKKTNNLSKTNSNYISKYVTLSLDLMSQGVIAWMASHTTN
jgi:hypothetical protein